MSRPTRRSALGGSGAALTAAALGSCAPPHQGAVNAEPTIPESDGPVTLTYWSWFKDLQKVCDIFNEKQDRIRVEATWISGEDYAKILSAVAAGGGPDIGHVDMRSVPEFALAGALVDLTRYGFAEQEDQFAPSAISQVNIENSFWAVPQDYGPVATFYNREVLEDELGLTPPATWEEFHETAGAVSETGKSLISLDPGDGFMPIAWVMQAGAVWFRPESDGWIVNMTDDASIRVAEFWDQILAEKIIGTGYGAFTTPWYAAAGEGKVLAAIGGSWSDALIKTVPDGHGKWAVAPMPVWQDGRGYASAVQGSSSGVILSNSQHPLEALEFLTWMSTDPESIDAMIEYSGIGWSTAKDYIGKARQQPSEFFSGQNYNEEVMVPMAEGQNLEWTWAPLMQRVSTIIGDGMTAAVNGEIPLTDMFANAQTEIVEIMREIGLDAEEAR
nr:extracellular solute-binding protein [Brachybacterium sacelli]